MQEGRLEKERERSVAEEPQGIRTSQRTGEVGIYDLLVTANKQHTHTSDSV